LEEVLDDPSRIFNGDETGFQICPSTGSVLAQKGAKNVYSIDTGSSKEKYNCNSTLSECY
jgi:predicted rRNA methylase YqxC with S4 and FtsJ domains